MRKISIFISSLLVLSSTVALNAKADTASYVGSGMGPGGVPVSATALMDFTGNLLTITLTNTSASNAGQDVPGSTLSGFFWEFKNSLNPSLTPVSATLGSGSSILGTCSAVNCAGVTDVGGEFGYAYQALGFPSGADRGIASSGYLTTGLPGDIGNFNNGLPGINLDNPASLDGINFGLVSGAAGYNPNGGLDLVPMIQSSVVFVLSGVNGLSNADVLSGNFQYGTSFSDLNVPDLPPLQVPEPSSLALLGLGLLCVGVARRKTKTASSHPGFASSYPSVRCGTVRQCVWPA